MLFNQPPLIVIRNRLSSWGIAGFNGGGYAGLVWLLFSAIPFLYAVHIDAFELLLTFLISIAVLQGWHIVFEKPEISHALPGAYTITQAMLFSLLLPLNISISSLLYCVSFGCVFGERVFGGRGYSFLHPVTVGLAFHLYSQNIDITSTAANFVPLWVVISVAVVMLVLELVSWRTILGVGVGVVPLCWILDFNDIQSLLFNSCMLIVLVFLALDPGSGGSTNPARWLHGVTSGLLFTLLYSQSIEAMLSLVFALLLASLSAPLLDSVVVQLHVSGKRRKRG